MFVVINIMPQMLATELVLNPESLITSLIQSNLLNKFYFGIIYSIWISSFRFYYLFII